MVRYAIVVDAKYSARITETHWKKVDKYSRIRSTGTNKQVVMQTWLAYPSSEPARVLDEFINWGVRGDLSEHIDGTVGLLPVTDSRDDKVNSRVTGNALSFVKDVMTYVGE